MNPLKLDGYSKVYMHKEVADTVEGSLYIAINQHGSEYETDAKSLLF